MSASLEVVPPSDEVYVEETASGKWFLRSETWKVDVFAGVLNDLRLLMPDAPASFGVGPV